MPPTFEGIKRRGGCIQWVRSNGGKMNTSRPEHLRHSREASTVIRKFTYRVMMERSKVIEENFKICIRGCPRWMPMRFYRWMIKNFVVLETSNG